LEGPCLIPKAAVVPTWKAEPIKMNPETPTSTKVNRAQLQFLVMSLKFSDGGSSETPSV